MSIHCLLLSKKDGMLLTVDNMFYIVERSGGEEAYTFIFSYHFFFFPEWCRAIPCCQRESLPGVQPEPAPLCCGFREE